VVRDTDDGNQVRVAVDARLHHGTAGGVQQFVIGLTQGLSQLDPGAEEYLFLADPDLESWLVPHLGWGGRLLRVSGPNAGRSAESWHRGLRRRAGALFPPARALWRHIRRSRGYHTDHLAQSDGTIERAGVDVMHFTFQGAFVTSLPSLYQPWDLQHVHLPEFFTDEERRWREQAYGVFSRQAEIVVVASEWTKRDLVEHYGLPSKKVAVIRVPPVASTHLPPDAATIASIADRFNLPSRFILYPAQTWPHKNHIRLLAALALLRDQRRLDVDLVCSGAQNDHYAEIRAEVRRRGLEGRVHFVGFVEPDALQALFRLSRALVFPSLFEGWGLPVLEAFEIGLPVACSNVTSLPDLVGDAALVFDPRDTDAMADAIASLWEDDRLCADLVARGRRVAAGFDWATTARTYRAHYRALANQRLSPADVALVNVSLGLEPA
jgi:glycosyltransferase involved in cell wall biosynthesis